jgi:hypothetical protein
VPRPVRQFELKPPPRSAEGPGPRDLAEVQVLLEPMQEAGLRAGLCVGLLCPLEPWYVRIRVAGGGWLLEWDPARGRARSGLDAPWRECRTWELALAAALTIRAERETEERGRRQGEQPAAAPAADAESGEGAGSNNRPGAEEAGPARPEPGGGLTGEFPSDGTEREAKPMLIQAQGLGLADERALELLPEIEAAAKVRGLRVLANRYVRPGRPPRWVVAVIVRPPGPGGNKRSVCWWPGWGKCRAAGRLRECPDWESAVEMAAELAEGAGHGAARPR